jgi:hypothetical protein
VTPGETALKRLCALAGHGKKFPAYLSAIFGSNIMILVADMYPNAQFHGMDLSPIQPDWVPENVLFVVDDIEHEAGWTYPENSFDYIHIRHTCHSIKNRTELWNRVYK